MVLNGSHSRDFYRWGISRCDIAERTMVIMKVAVSNFYLLTGWPAEKYRSSMRSWGIGLEFHSE